MIEEFKDKVYVLQVAQCELNKGQAQICVQSTVHKEDTCSSG